MQHAIIEYVTPTEFKGNEGERSRYYCFDKFIVMDGAGTEPRLTM